MTDFRDRLLTGFDYDLWANLRWLNSLPKFKDHQRADDVLRHIWFGQLAWLNRINDAEFVPFEDLQSKTMDEAALKVTGDGWRALLTSTDLVQITVVPRDGKEYQFALQDMAHHVLNHGTYHLGHLRGLAQAEVWDDFDETDYTAWLRETGQAVV